MGGRRLQVVDSEKDVGINISRAKSNVTNFVEISSI